MHGPILRRCLLVCPVYWVGLSWAALCGPEQKFLLYERRHHEKSHFSNERRPNMGPREKERVLQLCREVDLLVTLDPGASDVGVLERARCKMNELVREEDLSAAEE